jgi:hypothetical protein
VGAKQPPRLPLGRRRPRGCGRFRSTRARLKSGRGRRRGGPLLIVVVLPHVPALLLALCWPAYVTVCLQPSAGGGASR